MMKMDSNKLYTFIAKALRETYAKLGVEEVKTNPDGFKELHYREGDLSYKDSYCGFFRSRGFEVVKYKNLPIWMCSYGGGMVEKNLDLAIGTFQFLKKVFLADTQGLQSFRGPKSFSLNDWKYNYTQKGGLEEFFGDEKIYFKDKIIFYHKIIGGKIVGK